MKTAVSLPDELFADAEALAAKLGMTRSGLFAAALAEFVARHRDRRIAARLDKVYAQEESRVPAGLRRAQAQSLGPERW